MSEFIKNYGFEIIAGLVSIILTAIGAHITTIYNRSVRDRTKRKIVKECVKAVEQMYKTLSGPEKLEKAKEAIVARLTEEGYTITELDMRILIESAVQEINKVKKTIFEAAEEDEETYEGSEG